MDLSRLSDEDLAAISSGDMSKVSDKGLEMLSNPPKPVKADTGFTGALKSGIENVKGAGYALAGRTGLMNPEEAEKEVQEHKRRASEVFQPTQESWSQAPITKIKELAGSSLPYIAAPIAGAALGSLAGPAAIAGVGAATLGSVGAGALQYTGTGLQRQMDEGKKLADTNLLAAGAAAVPSAILDRVGLGMVPGIRQIFGAAGKEISESVAKKLAEKGLMSTVGSYALATGKAMGTEGVTETAQQFLERLQAGLSLTDQKARDEYFDSFIGGAVLGGTLAVPGTFYERNIAKEPAKAPPTTEGNPPPTPPSGTEQPNAPLLLAAPSERYIPPETTDPLLNPLGAFTSADLSAKEITHINSLRKEAGKPRLPHAFSIEDIADSNPPEGVMERLIAHRTGYTGEETKPNTVLNIAAQRGIDTSTPGFKDFLMRSTGSSDLATMSPPQLFAAAKAMENVQRGEDLNILQAGISNARHYTADQYNDAVDAADSAFKQYGKNQALGRGEMLKTIGKATGLTKESDQERILERAVAEGHLERIVTGMKDKTTGETKPVESFKPATGLTPLPGGMDIREEMFKHGEQPAGYEVVAGGQALSPHATEEEAVAAANQHQNNRMIEAQKIQNQINGYQTAVNSRNEELTQMQSVGQGNSHEFFTKSADYYAKNQIAQQAVEQLKQQQAAFVQPVGIRPMGMKPVVSKQHTLYEKGQEVGRFESPYQAEEFGISRLSNKMLQRIVDSAATQTQTGRVKRYADMAKNELYRRREAIETGTESYIKTKQGLEGSEERLAKLGIYSNATKEKIDAIHKNLYGALKRFGLEKVGLRIVHSIEDGRADGTYVKSLITVALDSDNPMGTLRHEVIHALKELGAFTAQEWRILTNKAKTEWVNKYLPKQLQEAYKNQYLQENGNLRGFDEYLQEEAIAEAFKHFTIEKPPAGFFANMFMRLKNFFQVLKSAFNKAGLPTSEAIFSGIEQGAYAPEMRQAREEARQAARPKYQMAERSYKLDIDREKRKLAKTASLNDEERAAILKDAQTLGLKENQVDEVIKDIVATKKRYPKTQGWAELTVKGLESDTDRKGNLKVTPVFKNIAYGYNNQDINKVAVKFTNEINKIYARAKAGDKNAKDIIAHQTWYKNVASTLRREYGGFGDLLSDLLGATSPNTPVDTNWKFSVDILERFVRGEFHKEMEAFTKYVDKGGRVSDFPDVNKIRQLSTKLYGMNSINAMKALADMWRGIEAGQAPKAKNFAANLIGKSNMATIDVWAARMLRRAANMINGADLPRIPPPAEKGVTGSWNTKATAVTGEYGFGAEVLEKVSQNLRKKGIAIDPPDLQAIAWFAEKELWGKKNWTTKVGEGGSFEENIENNPAQRYLAGVSAQQGEEAPSRENVKRVQDAIEATLSKDKSVLAFRAKETKGLYGNTVEESFDTEWVAKQGYDPTAIVSTLAQQAKNNEQYDIIVSKVINPTEANANARPGVEIYFMDQQSMNNVMPVLQKFTSKGQDGFTLVVDPRAKDDRFMGVRLQYCPEISMRWDEALRKQLLTPEGLESVIAEKYLALYKIAAEVSAMQGIAHAKMVNYDSIVIGKENYDNYISTTDRTGSPQAGERVWFGQPIREHVETAVRRYSEPEGSDTGTVEQPSGEKYSLRAPDTAEFKQWFEGSKVKNKNGNPTLVYTGTSKDKIFDKFNISKNGVWFAEDPEIASNYARDNDSMGFKDEGYTRGWERKITPTNTASRVIPAFLNIKNPFKMTDKIFEEYLQTNGERSYKRAQGSFFERLRFQGYDGVDMGSGVWVVLKDPKQIKSPFNEKPISSGQKFSLALGKLEPTTFLVSDKNPNNTGDLAYMPDAAPFPQLPIRLPVGIHNEDTNGGYGANHILRRAKTNISHRPVEVTKEGLEDTILQLQKIGKEFKRIYRSGPNLVLYDPITDDAMFVLPRADHYEVQTMYSSKDIGRKFGDAIWSGRNVQPSEPMGFAEKQQGISVKSSSEGRVVPTNVAAVTTAYKRPVMTSSNVEAVADTPRVKGTLGVKRSLRGMVPQDIEDAVNRTTTGRDERGFVERMMDAISPHSMAKIRQALVNKYEAIERLSQRVAKEFGNEHLLADTSAIAAALQSDRAAGIAAASFRDGIPVFRKGYTYVSNENGKVKGLIETLQPLMKYDDPKIFQYFQFYAGTVRGKRLMENGKEKTFTPEDIKRGKELANLFPEFPEVFKQYQIYNQGLVQYMKDTGVISDAEAKTWTENWDYIPFYRQMEGEDTVGPKVFSGVAGVSKPKALKGSEYYAVVDTEGKEIARYLDANRANTEAAKLGASVEKRGVELADFMETIVRNARAAVEAGMKNEAGRRVVRDIVQVGMGEKVPLGTTGTDIVNIKENGVTSYYRVADPLLVEALKGLNLPQLPFLNILAAPANLLRNFVTKDPGFILANLGRDSMQAWITSGTGMTPLVDTFKQFGKTLANKSPEAAAMARAGLTGYDFAGDVKSTARKVEEELRKRSGKRTTTETVLRPLSAFWEMLDHGSHASDMATRAEVYKRTLERTGSEAEALYQAMEVLNFSRKGNSAVIRIMSAMVPFFNARVQGLDILYRSGWGKMATENKEAIQKAFMFRALTLLGLSAMYWAAVSDDDEYKKLTKEERDNYWIAPGFNINGKPFRFPIPFELGVVFKVIPERILEYNFGTDTGKDLRESLVRNAMSTLSFNPIPQAVLPVVENIANYSFFTGDPIVSQGMQGLAPQFQVNQSTSQLAKTLASGINSTLPEDMKVSPIKLDNFIRGYTGTMGTYATMMIDSTLTSEGDPAKATKRLEQLPVIKRFFATDTGTISAFYDLKTEVDTVVQTVNTLARTGNQDDLKEYLKDNQKLYGLKNYVTVIDQNMKQLNNMTKIINQSKTMDSDEKRVALDRIHDAQVKLTERIRILKKQYE